MLRSTPPVTTVSNWSLDQALDRRVHRGHRRRAGRVDDEVRPAQVEQVRDAPGEAVAELARHRVLGGRRQVGLHARVQLGGDRGAHVRRQRGEARGVFEVARELGEREAQRRQVVLLARHRVAEDHRGALEVERPAGPAVVHQRHARAGDRPLLGVVHRLADARRDRQLPGERVPVPLAHPAADLRVRLVGRLRVGVVVERGIPARRVDVADRVVAVAQVGPEGVASGASGRMAPTPTMATARSAEEVTVSSGFHS